MRVRVSRGDCTEELDGSGMGLLLHRLLRTVLHSQVDRMNAIRDWFKSLRLAILAGRAEYHRNQWRAKRRRQLPDYFS
jgi:hypothetical protein